MSTSKKDLMLNVYNPWACMSVEADCTSPTGFYYICSIGHEQMLNFFASILLDKVNTKNAMPQYLYGYKISYLAGESHTEFTCIDSTTNEDIRLTEYGNEIMQNIWYLVFNVNDIYLKSSKPIKLIVDTSSVNFPRQFMQINYFEFIEHIIANCAPKFTYRDNIVNGQNVKFNENRSKLLDECFKITHSNKIK